MAKTEPIAVKELKLDLKNFRTLPQPNEESEVHAIVSIKPDWFWALTESLLDGGYLPTENIIVLKGGRGGQQLIVKEGNRRISALKLILGHVSSKGLSIPIGTDAKMRAVTAEWKKANREVPCAIYESDEAEKVDRIVTLAHGKGAQAGRDNWTSVARARHNREKNHIIESGLDLLEKYLSDGKNLTAQEAEQWAGDYPLSVLDDAMPRIAARIGIPSARELAVHYPKIAYRREIESVVYDIGVKKIGFEILRDKVTDFAEKYGFPAPPKPPAPTPPSPPTSPPSSPAPGGGTPVPIPKRGRRRVFALNDPKGVIRKLRKFQPRGNGREKVVTLLEEARMLKLERHPLSFCFLLRSMFEISAKAYCKDHVNAGLSATKPSGEDKRLLELLKEVTKHLTNNYSGTNPMTKVLHSAITELSQPHGLLSVTSLNQLIHNPNFSVDASHISTVFNNIYPLLEALNS